jgi:ABC-type phosphate/phosphonate transport system substrate-binding protein
MIAALPMYDLPHVMPANDRLWARIRDGLRAVGQNAPDTLSRGADDLLVQWTAPDLLLSQTCGMPYRTRLHGKVTLIGTPDYGLQDCPPGHYRSVFLAHKDDPRQRLDQFDGANMAYNDAGSQSGWAAPQNHAATLGLTLRPTLRTGGHRLSMLAVAEERAPLAALDAMTWCLLQDHDPVTKGVKVVGHTTPTPGLPYIAALNANQPLLFAVISAAIAAMSDQDRAATRLRGLVAIPAAAYLAVPIPAAA